MASRNPRRLRALLLHCLAWLPAAASHGARCPGDAAVASSALDEVSMIQVDRSTATRRARPAAAQPQGCQNVECLERFVSHVDPEFSWSDTGRRLQGEVEVGGEAVGYTGYVLNVTSIRYLEPGMVNVHIWWHPTVVVVPSNLDPQGPLRDFATFVIGGAQEGLDVIPADFSNLAAGSGDIQAAVDLAVRTGAIAVAYLLVPNQPVVFAADPLGRERTEDAWKAYSEQQALHEPERMEWNPVLPMAQAAARGMDAVAQWSAQALPSGELRRFAPTGCSKRGLTTWTLSTVDPRVVALMSCSIVLNTSTVIHDIFRGLGNPPLALHDYRVEGNLFDTEAETQVLQPLSDIGDATDDMTRLTMPKLVMMGTEDEFFPPDSVRAFFPDLPGPKHILEVPNIGHQGTLSVGNFIPGMAAFLRGVLLQQEPPGIRWTIDNATGDIEVTQVTDHAPPLSVTVWSARTCDGSRRDFRSSNMDDAEACTRCGGTPTGMGNADAGLPSCNSVSSVSWSAAPLQETAPGSRAWRASMAPPANGWGAFFVHFTYAPLAGSVEPYQSSTEVSVVPNTYPFPECEFEECAGTRLVLLEGLRAKSK